MASKKNRVISHSKIKKRALEKNRVSAHSKMEKWMKNANKKIFKIGFFY